MKFIYYQRISGKWTISYVSMMDIQILCDVIKTGLLLRKLVYSSFGYEHAAYI